MTPSGPRTALTVALRELRTTSRSRAAWAANATFVALQFGLLLALLRLHDAMTAASEAGSLTSAPGLLAPHGANTALLIVAFAPLLALRSVAGSPTAELHLGAPVRSGAVVAGLWGAATVRLGALVLLAQVPLLFLPALVASPGPRLGALLVVLVSVGAVASAVGVLGATLSSSKTAAVALSWSSLIFLWLWARDDHAGLSRVVQRMAEGLVTLPDLGFLVAVGGGALVVAAAALESRRWR